MALELPSSFANEHREEISQDAALVRPTYGSAAWWLRFEVRHFSNFLTRVCTFGGGWRDFVLDNGINIGGFLVFELVSTDPGLLFTCILVMINLDSTLEVSVAVGETNMSY